MYGAVRDGEGDNSTPKDALTEEEGSEEGTGTGLKQEHEVEFTVEEVLRKGRE